VARDIGDARKSRVPALSSGLYIKYEGWILGKILLLDKNWASVENLQILFGSPPAGDLGLPNRILLFGSPPREKSNKVENVFAGLPPL
jgi:hypothetical protein